MSTVAPEMLQINADVTVTALRSIFRRCDRMQPTYGGVSVALSADVERLLQAAPWLYKYGVGFAEALVRLGVRDPAGIADVDPEQYAALPGVGKTKLAKLFAAQRELIWWRSTQADPDEFILPETFIRDLGFVRDGYSARLLNCLGKMNVTTVGQVLELDPLDFSTTRGVGNFQVKLLVELQEHLRRLVVGPGSNDQPSGRQNGLVQAETKELEFVQFDTGGATEEALHSFETQELSAIWEVWSDLPVVLRNCLGINGIRTVSQVLATDPDDFAELRGVGAKRVRALVELRETLRHMRLQQGIDTARCSGAADPASLTPGTAAQPTPETTTRWASLEALLLDVAAQVSANRTYTAEKNRNLEIWLSYHGLGPAAVDRTLDAVGAVHGLTRERVRQIVTRLTQIVADEIAHSAALAPFRAALGRTLARCLGLACTDDLAILLAQEMDWERPPSVGLVETLDEVLRGTTLEFGYRRGEASVQHPDACEALRQRVTHNIESLLQEIHESEHILDFVYHLTQACRTSDCQRSRFTSQIPCCGGERGEMNLPVEYVKALLSTLTPSPLEGDRVWGYWWTRLRIARPKYEAIRAALHILGRPVHYSELTNFICNHNPAFSPADERYVHTQLINGEEYILTTKLGTYGLRVWGIDKYFTVSERVEQLLRTENHPLSLGMILHILKAQGIPENNIRGALEQRKFIRDNDGLVRLVEWEQQSPEVEANTIAVAGLLVDDEDTSYIL